MSEEKKIVVNESWKEQVEREKQQAEAERQAAAKAGADQESPRPADTTDAPVDAADAPAAATDDSATADSATASPAAEPAAKSSSQSPIPPASFTVLVSSLATQAVAALGFLPDADGKPRPAEKDIAKHFIDTLSMLEEKTKGNLDAEEANTLHTILHEVRMAYLSVKA